jgi:threonine/homoserine/homoserine lactone efflux protein
MAAELLAFLAVAAAVIVTPGQDTALTIRNTLAGGRRAGVLTAVGVSSGQACWTVAASAGVAALLVASERVFDAIRLAGAAYLVFLGVSALRDAFRGRSEAQPAPRRLRPGAAYRQGLVSNLGNPKMAIFFTSLLPQFGTSYASSLAFGLAFCGLTLAWLSWYAVVVERLGDVVRRGRVRRALDAVTGTALVAVGLRVATAPAD